MSKKYQSLMIVCFLIVATIFSVAALLWFSNPWSCSIGSPNGPSKCSIVEVEINRNGEIVHGSHFPREVNTKEFKKPYTLYEGRVYIYVEKKSGFWRQQVNTEQEQRKKIYCVATKGQGCVND